MTNPLFPTDNEPDKSNDNSYILPDKRSRRVEPVSVQYSENTEKSSTQAAANIARVKLDKLYADAPNARQEAAEASAELPKARSKHQEFMFELSTSGKSLAEIQTAWHNYYTNLPDHEKHEVWQEFYAANGGSHYVNYTNKQAATGQDTSKATVGVGGLSQEELSELALATPVSQIRRTIERRSRAAAKKLRSYVPDVPAVTATRQKIRKKVIRQNSQSQASFRRKLTVKQHFQSLLFGLGVGAVVIIITLFSFFNEVIIAPFIQPSRTVSATPLILGADSVAPTDKPEVIIPKINVEIPLVGFDLTTTNEADVENALEDGVTHYPTTVLPGQVGNTAFFGHSSNNIFNPGHYKFAFTLLHELVPGDTFYLTYNHKVYAYQVFEKKIVPPDQVSVLQETHGKVATAALITCDPPGTSNNRLVVWGEQVSPSPTGNISAKPQVQATPTEIYDNGPSLWDRMIHGITSWF